MKRILPLHFFSFLVLFLLLGTFTASGAGEEPVYVFLTARIYDHINVDMSEDRLRRILPMVEKYRKAHPEAHVSATILFSGAASRALSERNSQTHIVDFVRDYIRRGVIEAGYDGSYEPTLVNRPLVQLRKTTTPEERWQARFDAAGKFLTQGSDPITGAPQPDVAGGLKSMQATFGDAAYISGLTLFQFDLLVKVVPDIGSDSETIHQLRRYNTTAVLGGISDASPVETLRYRDWAQTFSNDLSPASNTVPELYYQDNFLRFSETTGNSNRPFQASNGVDALKSALDKLDRSKPRIIRVELGGDRDYLTPAFTERLKYPPLKLAYNNPDKPQLPAEAHRPDAEVDAAFAKEDAVLQWLTSDFLAANPSSHLLSNAGLKQMVAPANGYSIPTDHLRAALAQTLNDWGDKPIPPKFLLVDGHYLSMADMFQVMTDELAGLSRSGHLPESVPVIPVFGPIMMHRASGPAHELTVASVAKYCVGLSDRLHDKTWTPVPNNTIPVRINFDDADMNPAQFLRLMAEAVVSGSPETKLTTKPEDLLWSREEIFLHTRPIADLVGVWTLKPASLLSAGPSPHGS
ncbi:MAG: hypothetical protein ACLPWF_20320 [Bryobacteraceae bacterium]